MQVYIFRGPGRVFGFTRAEDAANLPESRGPWTPFKSTEMHRDEPHAGVDVNSCLHDIDEHGFHLTDAHERITHLVVGAAQ
ncbi:hypothetical protein [Sphingomonas oleivorans]|uniref:hypothetical protein n=1 Tax=Sphingomonas oleivorans TaxID=1735121 RepID=UPI00105751A9|nr:hypothetical protein [Sphingomonas oleivorans]